jgi:hypothetical protein
MEEFVIIVFSLAVYLNIGVVICWIIKQAIYSEKWYFVFWKGPWQMFSEIFNGDIGDTLLWPAVLFFLIFFWGIWVLCMLFGGLAYKIYKMPKK